MNFVEDKLERTYFSRSTRIHTYMKILLQTNILKLVIKGSYISIDGHLIGVEILRLLQIMRPISTGFTVYI